MASPTISTPLYFDRTVLCPEKHLFGHTYDPQPRAYEPIWPMPLAPQLMTFDMDSLNWAVSCVHMHLQLSSSTQWYHVSVSAVAFSSFLEAMDSDEGRTRTLPFSCWCDGKNYTEASHRQHRHMIVVTPSANHFTRYVWKKIRIPSKDRPGSHFRCIYKEPIRDTQHLVQTLGYVSQYESLCQFSEQVPHSPEKQNHYYIFTSLPKDYRLVLYMQWAGGLDQLLNLDFKNMKWEELVLANMERPQGKWEIKVKDIPGIPLGKVLPVSKDLIPCDHPTNTYLHLLQGHKLYFERNADLCHLTPEAWKQEQACKGNLFYDAVGEQSWIPRPFQQKVINAFRPDVNRIVELESKNAQLQEALNQFQESGKSLKKKCVPAEQIPVPKKMRRRNSF